MDQFKYPRLFTPIKLGNTWFRNRIFASPTGFLDTDYSGALPPEAALCPPPSKRAASRT